MLFFLISELVLENVEISELPSRLLGDTLEYSLSIANSIVHNINITDLTAQSDYLSKLVIRSSRLSISDGAYYFPTQATSFRVPSMYNANYTIIGCYNSTALDTIMLKKIHYLQFKPDTLDLSNIRLDTETNMVVMNCFSEITQKINLVSVEKINNMPIKKINTYTNSDCGKRTILTDLVFNCVHGNKCIDFIPVEPCQYKYYSQVPSMSSWSIAGIIISVILVVILIIFVLICLKRSSSRIYNTQCSTLGNISPVELLESDDRY